MASQASFSAPSADTAASSHENILVLDFGGQTARLIARRVRECRVYSELIPWNTPWQQIEAMRPKGIILSGSPHSVFEPEAPLAPRQALESGLPVLGICYGLQLVAHQLGGRVAAAQKREYGPAVVIRDVDNPLFSGLPEHLKVWMSHGDVVTELPPGFRPLAHSDNSPFAAVALGDSIFGIQFHPEVVHTQQGRQIIENFVFNVCGCRGDWTPSSFVEQAVAEVRQRVGDGRVVCGLSGGVDSAVAAALIDRAIGDRLTCVFVDNGLLRQGEAEEVVAVFSKRLQGEFRHAQAGDRFLGWLAGVEDPESKRKIIGEQFVRIFEEEAARIGKVDFLAQGTLYPDVIESTSHDTTSAQRIKTHHNVGGLPEKMGLKLVEPLRYLFKDEVREVGSALGLPESMVWRQPFPGPGLAVRVIGAVTEERLAILRSADAVVRDEIEAAGLTRSLWQSFAILTPLRSVGVMGDGRTYANVVAIRAVTSDDAMTADWARIPYEVLGRMANRIVNEVPGVNRVVYDVTSKPPATIEWE